MTDQLKSLANRGYLAGFVGMLTDSRSFLSYPRHEYFRRILCRIFGEWVEDGFFPEDAPSAAASSNAFCVRPRGFAIFLRALCAGSFSPRSIFPMSEDDNPACSARAACVRPFWVRASRIIFPSFFDIAFPLLISFRRLMICHGVFLRNRQSHKLLTLLLYRFYDRKRIIISESEKSHKGKRDA
jgi:hypothetical protein